MAALVPAPATCTYSSPSNLCGELEVHCFVHILESDQVVIQFVVPSFPLQCSMLGIVLSRRMMKYMYTYMMSKGPCTMESDCILRLCCYYYSAFFVNRDEFEKLVEIVNYIHVYID